MRHDLATAADVRDAFVSGEVSATEICESALARIRARDAGLHAFLAIDADRALARARALDALDDRR